MKWWAQFPAAAPLSRAGKTRGRVQILRSLTSLVNEQPDVIWSASANRLCKLCTCENLLNYDMLKQLNPNCKTLRKMWILLPSSTSLTASLPLSDQGSGQDRCFSVRCSTSLLHSNRLPLLQQQHLCSCCPLTVSAPAAISAHHYDMP